jgi:hypothetical protein
MGYAPGVSCRLQGICEIKDHVEEDYVSGKKCHKTVYNAGDVISSDSCAICTERDLRCKCKLDMNRSWLVFKTRKVNRLMTMKAHHALHKETVVFRQLTVIVGIDLDVYHSP